MQVHGQTLDQRSSPALCVWCVPEVSVFAMGKGVLLLWKRSPAWAASLALIRPRSCHAMIKAFKRGISSFSALRSPPWFYYNETHVKKWREDGKLTHWSFLQGRQNLPLHWVFLQPMGVMRHDLVGLRKPAYILATRWKHTELLKIKFPGIY